MIFIKLDPNVPISETVRRTIDSAMQTQGQGRTSRSYDLPFGFVSTLYLMDPLKGFHISLLKCYSQCEGVQSQWLSYPDSRSRTHFKVMGFSCGGLSCPSDCCLVLYLHEGDSDGDEGQDKQCRPRSDCFWKKQSDKGHSCLLFWQAFCELQPWKPIFYMRTDGEKHFNS